MRLLQAGSWGPLIGLSVAFLILFWWLRSDSVFLAIAAERQLAQRVAAAAGIEPAAVMALRETLGPAVPEPELVERGKRLVTLTPALGERLAVLDVCGHEELAARAWREAGKDAEAGWERVRGLPEAVVVARFLSMRERFAALLAGDGPP